MPFDIIMGMFFLWIAAFQLATRTTEIGGSRLPGFLSLGSSPWRFWVMFGINLAIGTFCIAAWLAGK
jgi:hypothetical protein